MEMASRWLHGDRTVLFDQVTPNRVRSLMGHRGVLDLPVIKFEFTFWFQIRVSLFHF